MIDKKKLMAYICLAIAALCLIFAIVCFTMDADYARGSTESNSSYGGDAYTGIQNAAAQTATNVYYLNKNLSNFATCVVTMGGFFFVIVALGFGLVGVKELGYFDTNTTQLSAEEQVEDLPAPEQEETPVPEETPVQEEAVKEEEPEQEEAVVE